MWGNAKPRQDAMRNAAKKRSRMFYKNTLIEVSDSLGLMFPKENLLAFNIDVSYFTVHG